MKDMDRQRDDRRKTQRFPMRVPLTVLAHDRETACFTRDLSNKGVYFLVDAHDEAPRPGGWIEFLIELPPEVTLSGSCLIRCHGRVARIDLCHGEDAGVAAEILRYRILNEPASRRIAAA